MRTTDRGRARRTSTALAVAAVSAAAFVALLGGLSIQLANGHDPALATTATTGTEPAQQPRRLLIRRVHRRIIVTHVTPAPRSSEPVAPLVGSAPVTSPTPAPAAPPSTSVAPTPTPAPAPAPAPVTSSS